MAIICSLTFRRGEKFLIVDIINLTRYSSRKMFLQATHTLTPPPSRHHGFSYCTRISSSLITYHQRSVGRSSDVLVRTHTVGVLIFYHVV